MNFFQLHEAIENFIGYTIYCDLDAVLVDLEKGLVDEMGLHDRPTRLEILKDLNQLEKDGHDLEVFFAALPWTPDGKNLWTYLRPYEPIIITAVNPESHPAVARGKYEWCKKELGLPKDRVICEPKKQIYARPKSILIDDWDRNIKHWREAGGIGILHTSAADSIDKLKSIIVPKTRKESRA